MFLLLASDVAPGQANPEEDEKIISAVYEPAKLEQMIGRGELHDAKSVAGLLYYFRYMTSTKTKQIATKKHPAKRKSAKKR